MSAPDNRALEFSAMTTELDLNFDGATFKPELDSVRLTGQWLRVWEVMRSGQWLTLYEIVTAINSPSPQSISARIRDFRKNRFGGHTVNRRRRGCQIKGLHEYQLVRKSELRQAA